VNERVFQPKVPHDLKGKVITVGVVISPMATCHRTGSGLAGIEIDMLESMASALNFTTVYKLSGDLMRKNDSELAKREDLYGPWGTVLLRIFAGEIDIAMGGFILVHLLNSSLGSTQPYAQDSYMFFATNDKVLSARTEVLIGIIILQMIIVHTFTSTAMHFLRQTPKGRRGDFGATAIMVRLLTS